MQELFSLFSKIENPTLDMVVFTFILAFICSLCIALTYYFTTPTNFKTANYIQALILSSVIATMILQSIGDNVASGLGILGALTIINFRTSFKDPRDIIFMFASLGVGIACGSFVFMVAVSGTVLFCLVAISLRYSNFSLGNHTVWMLRIKLGSGASVASIENVLHKFCKRFALDALRNSTNNETETQERDYLIVFNNEESKTNLLMELKALGIEVRRLSNQNSESTEV